MMLNNEGSLPPKNEQVFEAISILLTVPTVRLIAQKWPEASSFLGIQYDFLNMMSKTEESLPPKNSQAF